ncbi:MAG: PQQ-dependent sugar dehydrogenase [Actinomycetota bacterium]|nr:PQQ-dependent sugar dehydrogenase [Actinomycetota bacterium]
MRLAKPLSLITAAVIVLAGCGDGEDPQPGSDLENPAESPDGNAEGGLTPQPSRDRDEPVSAGSDFADPQTVLAGNLAVPWGIAFLPNGDALIAERTTARILRLDASGGEPEEAMTVPGVDTDAGEGGLLGLAVSPRYERDGLVFAYLTSAEDNRIVRFQLGEEPEPILTGIARSEIHNGGRIAFGPDGNLYAGVGDAANPAFAQDPGSLNGKILRLEPDGSIPKDNPLDGSHVYSLGHRNVQGLAWDSEERLWATEFGQDAFDEVNLIEPGQNYGWPQVEGEDETASSEFTNPQVTWATSESSPSGAAIVDGDLYVAALVGERLWRVPLDGDTAGEPESFLDGEYGRIRTAVKAPDGSLWIATSNTDGRGAPAEDDDRIVRLEPPTGG